MSEALRVERSGPIANVTLQRPEVHNALSQALIVELTRAVDALGADAAVRVIVLRGAGKSFCAGADLRYMQDSMKFGPAENLQDALAFADLFHALRRAPQPVVVAAHGAVYGGGVGLVAASDIAGCTRDARFCLSEVKLGLIPSVISPFVLERIGMTAYRRYALTAEVLDGAEAKRVGLVAESVESPAQLDAWVATIAEALRRNGPQALARAKREIQAVAGMPWDTLRERTAQAIAELRVSAEGQEGLRAFLEKRPPAWHSP